MTTRKTVWTSEVYSPDRQFDLCEPCGKDEEAAIDEAGTNDLPELRARYERTMHRFS